MKVAVLSESPADEAAIRILLDGILGRPTQSTDIPPIQTRDGLSRIYRSSNSAFLPDLVPWLVRSGIGNG